MTLLRRAARPMLASIFITGGLDAFRHPGTKVAMAEGLTPQLQRIPALADYDTETLVKINGGIQAGAGAMFALGRFPRLSSLALAASLIPTTTAGHRFWEMEAPERKQQQVQFFKNLSILGGLLIASADTAGKPGLGWRTRHTAEHAGAAVRRGRREARHTAKLAKQEAKLAAKHARAKLPV